MCTLHTGVVKTYDRTDRTGSVRLDKTGELLPFSFEDGRCFTELDGRIDWLDARVMREPNEREQVMVEIGCRGDQKVVRWGDGASHSVIERRLKERALAA